MLLTIKKGKNVKFLIKPIIKLVLISTLLSLMGCAAVNTAVSKHDLDVQTKMSASIFLDPVAPSQKVAYVGVHNTSGQSLDVTSAIKSDIEAEGYRITDDPTKAHYLLQVNVLRIGKADKRDSSKSLAHGYGGAITGMAIGTGTAIAAGGDTDTAIAGGLIGGAAGSIADALVKDQVYTMVTDVQISERAAKGQKLHKHSTSVLKQGTSGQEVITGGGDAQWMRYRTRVVSTAEKVNLKFADAKPVLEKELAKSIAGIL